MHKEKSFVKITLQTEIVEDNDQQLTCVEANGEWFQSKSQAVIRFIERIEDQPEVNTMITIKSEKITIKRSGAVEMTQQFIRQKKTEHIYRHPYGVIHMETYTEKIDYQPLTPTHKGELVLHYTTKLNQQAERQHKVRLTIEEDNR
ncbi:DUF1934 domain-containing protein [Amphibacillus jilinensis]|uniref:DUF1934 domain-containing protein n=1 Tax=Amphibacillus jilinensis TaxID=1216008 RepID=UPI0002F95C55|nr:DUF1934 domain-containing protein [Amphibacillus jilinensis]